MKEKIPKGIKVRDNRNQRWFWVNRCIIRCWAKKIGPWGITIYALLADHDRSPDHPGVVFPSQKSMAKILGCARSTVNKYLRILSREGVISKDERSRYHITYILNEVKCPNSIDEKHVDSTSRDVAENDILKNKVHLCEQDVAYKNSDVVMCNTKEDKKERFKNKDDSLDKKYFKKVSNFTPKYREESICFDIAKKLDEPYMNWILSKEKQCGIGIIEQAWGLYKEDIQRGKKIENPSAYFNGIVENLINQQEQND